MTPRILILITWRGWTFQNGHLFIAEETGNAKGTARWRQQRCLFCGILDYQLGRKIQP